MDANMERNIVKLACCPNEIKKIYYFLLGRLVSGNINLISDKDMDVEIYCKNYPNYRNIGCITNYLTYTMYLNISAFSWENMLLDNFYTDYLYDFLRGYCCFWGYYVGNNFYFGSYLNSQLENISKNLGIPNEITLSGHVGKIIKLSPLNTFDFIGKLYSDDTIRTNEGYNKYIEIISDSNRNLHYENVNFVKSLNDAVTPTKSRISDSGYDLTLIRKIKEENGIHFFNTGIRISPSFGWYFDIVARSSISKMGWMLANNIGIIDQSYTGDIIVALVPVVPNPKEIVLPLRIVQIIPRRVYNCIFSQVESLDETQRACDGGITRS